MTRSSDSSGEITTEIAASQSRLGLGQSPIDSLDGLTTGRYVITTEHGTRHLVDLDRRNAIRIGAPGREWDGRLFVPVPRSVLSGNQPKFAVRSEQITPDGEKFTYTSISGCSVGGRMRLDNDREWRITSMIVRIEAIGDGSS